MPCLERFSQQSPYSSTFNVCFAKILSTTQISLLQSRNQNWFVAWQGCGTIAPVMHRLTVVQSFLILEAVLTIQS